MKFGALGLVLMGGHYTPAANTLFAAMTTPPTGLRKQQIDTLIRALQVAGVWSLCDAIYAEAAANSQAAGLNWKSPGTLTLSATNAPTFTTDRGYTGDGASSYLSTGYNPLSASLGMTQNDAHVSVFSLTNSTSSGYDLISDNGRNRVKTRDGTSTVVSVSVNSATFTAAVGGNNPHQIIGIRRDSANQLLFRNGVQESTQVMASSGLPNTITLLGNATIGTYSNRQNAIATIGRALTDAQALALYNACFAYLHALGAV